MSFSFPTQLAEILVAGGDTVSKGQLLARAHDVRILAEVEFERIRADSKLDVDLAEAELEIAQINFDAAKEVREGGGGSQAEFLQRENQLKQATIRFDMAEISHKQRQALLTQKLAELDTYRLTAPFDGQVESIGMDVGNSANDGEPVIRIVQINPLRLDVPTPIEQTIGQGLKVGGRAWVLMDIPGQPQVLEGKISEISPVADFASQKQRVRVEVSNQQQWPAGLTAWVRFTEPGERWLKLMPQTSVSATPADRESTQ